MSKELLGVISRSSSIVARTALTPLAEIPVRVGLIVGMALCAVCLDGLVVDAERDCSLPVPLLPSRGVVNTATPTTSVGAVSTDNQHSIGLSVRVSVLAVSSLPIGVSISPERIVYDTLLFGLVSHVVGVCSKEEMSRVDARRVVASVQDLEVIRDSAVYDDPCTARGTHVLAFDGESTVTLTVAECQPRPAFVFSFAFDFRPESFCNSGRHRNSICDEVW